jgi:RNA-directed DNA polymerase
MRRVSSLVKTLNWSARALAGKPRESRNRGDAKKRPLKLARLNFVVATRERLAMKKIKVHSLTGRITSRLMRQAFQAVKRNRGAAGVDKVSIHLFAANLEENLAALMRELKTGTFRPLPLRRVYIPKGPGSTKLRPLGIPVVRDRVAQEVIRRLLAPIFEPQFHENSYGFISGRNCHQAIERVLELHRQGHLVVLDADIQGFFDNLSHRVIMAAVAAEVADGNVLTLVERFLTAGVMEDGVFKPTTIGTPQGGVISPLLANIVLNRLDWQLHQAGYRFVRYADDFVVLCQDPQQAQEALDRVKQVLEGELGLCLSPEKTKITTYGKGYDFLGFHLSSRSRRMRDKSEQKFKAKVREFTERHRNLDRAVIVKLNQVIRGTANFFATSFSTCRWRFQKLDSWIRMRLRAMKLKRKNYNDNHKLRGGFFGRQLGLLTLEEFCTCRDRHGQARRVIPRNGATSVGVARCVTRTPVNVGN